MCIRDSFETFCAAAGDHRGKPARTAGGGSAGGTRANPACIPSGLRLGGVWAARRPYAYGDHRGFALGLVICGGSSDIDRPLRSRRDFSLPAAYRIAARLADAFRHARTITKGPRMSGKNSLINPLASRKELLIAESELNRAQLVQEWRMMTDEVHSLTNQARTISSLASSAASLVVGLASFRRKKSAAAAEKRSWWQTIFKGAGLFSSLYQAFCPPGCDPK